MQKDYYLILGVLPDAEEVVIKAAHKALVQRYHPDRFKGSVEEAQRRIQDLNEAYEVLSNPVKRADYDRQRQAQKNGSTSDYDEIDDDSDVDMMQQDWSIALEFYPDLKEIEARLRRISAPLAVGFRQVLLSSKDFDQRSSVAKQLERRFLENYFGSHPKVIEFATQLIMDGKRDAAKELNGIVRVVGSKVDPSPIIRQVYAKYYADKIKAEAEVEARRQEADAAPFFGF